MRSTLSSLAALVLIPTSALALNIAPILHYTDESTFTSAEYAGIYLLTNLAVINGYPDGSFRPQRLINRAEFAKILVNVYFLHNPDQQAKVGNRCFPDVPPDSWFASHVCTANFLGIIKGNPDGRFHPEQTINYAEAITMLARLFKYTLSPEAYEAWYAAALRAATERGTTLPSSPLPGKFLTRGEAIRLIAGFDAESRGALPEYRSLESGVRSSSSSLSSSRSSSSSAPISYETINFPEFPSRSRLLLAGTQSEPIADGQIVADRESVIVRGATLTLKSAVRSIDAMFLIDDYGREIGRLTPESADATGKTWKGTFDPNGYDIESGKTANVGIVVKVKPYQQGAVSQETLEVQSLKLSLFGTTTRTLVESALTHPFFPKSQTTFARITLVESTLPERDTLPQGTQKLLASFGFKGDVVAGASLELKELVFDVSSEDVLVQHWQLGTTGNASRVPCTMSGNRVTCSGVPAWLGSIGSSSAYRTVQLFGDVSATAESVHPYIQVSLNAAGSPDVAGAIRFTDGGTSFSWIEQNSPLAHGPMWEG